MWNLLTTFMSDPTIQSFFVSCGASASWDAVKKILGKAERDNSFVLQVYHVIKETFESFYLKYELEFEEDIVMTSFLETISEIGDFNSSNITKKMIRDSIGLDIDDEALEEWIKIFIVKCSNPKYQWVYNKLALSFIKVPESSKHKMWMHYYMKDNFCKIQCDMVDELSPIFDDIATQLSPECWYATRVLIWEILFNAQEHGKAKECMLHINENSITVLDDGEQFNPFIIEKQTFQKGGGMAIKKFMRDYPDVSLKSKYYENKNQFTVKFDDNVFDVNGMSEIIVPCLAIGGGQYRLKHPRGKFRFYYINIDEIYGARDKQLLASYSGIIGLFENLKNNIDTKTVDGKIFIYFSDMNRIDYQQVYGMMDELLKEEWIIQKKIDIVLVTDNFV